MCVCVCVCFALKKYEVKAMRNGNKKVLRQLRAISHQLLILGLLPWQPVLVWMVMFQDKPRILVHVAFLKRAIKVRVFGYVAR